MAKENFDRSKPHVRITGTDADFGFVFADGSLQVIHYEDGNGDGFVAVNLEANHKALAVDDGSLGSHETTLNLDRVSADPQPEFQIGQTVQVNDGTISEWSLLNVRDGTQLSALVADPLNVPPAYTGVGKGGGFRGVPDPRADESAVDGRHRRDRADDPANPRRPRGDLAPLPQHIAPKPHRATPAGSVHYFRRKSK